MIVNCNKCNKKLCLYSNNISVKGINIFCNNCHIDDLAKRGILNTNYKK